MNIKIFHFHVHLLAYLKEEVDKDCKHADES